MKTKRLSAFVFAAVFAFALLGAIRFGVKTDKASADIQPVLKYEGAVYDVEYILRDLGVEKIEGKDTYAKGRKVEYVLDYDYATESSVAEDTAEYAESTKKTLDSSTVKFRRANCRYRFDITDDGEESPETYYVKTVAPDGADHSTTYDTAKIGVYEAALQEYADGLNTSSTFNFDKVEQKVSISTFVKKDQFDILKTKVVVNYCLPGSESSSSATGADIENVSFKTSKKGDYSFYFTFTDETGVADSVEDLLVGDGGYYKDVDGDGELSAEDVLQIPVFTFTISKASKPEVSLTTSEKSYLGLEYKIDCFNITASDYTAQYKLYFIPESNANAEYDKDDEQFDVDANGDDLYIKAVTENPDVKDVTDMLDTDSMKFMPDQKGYYYALLDIRDNNGNGGDRVMSYAIPCLDEYTEVKTEKQFFKYNSTSIIFLSISALSFIGIIVVLLVKPKEEKDLETKDGNE